MGDSKTLAIHPWTTTHEQLSDQEKLDGGVTDDMIRISVGTEHIDDIIRDFEQSFAASRAAREDAPISNKEAKGDIADASVSIAGAT